MLGLESICILERWLSGTNANCFAFVAFEVIRDWPDAVGRARAGRTCSTHEAASTERSEGEVAEWSKAPVSKTGKGETSSRVRISSSPPIQFRVGLLKRAFLL